MKKSKNENKIIIIVSLLFIILITTFTIGYAKYDKILGLNGSVTIYKEGQLLLESVQLISTDRPEDTGSGLILEDGQLLLDYAFELNKTGEFEYEDIVIVTLYNDSHEEYIFSGINLNPEITLNGIAEGNATATITYEYVDVEGSNLNLQNNTIPGGQRGYLGIKLSIYIDTSERGSIGIGGGADIETTEEAVGQFYGYLSPTNPNLDLKNQNIDCFSFEVLNTYNTEKTFTIIPGNNSFEFVNSSGMPLGNLSISAPSELDPESNIQTYNACVKTKDTALFRNNTANTTVVLTQDNGPSYSIGTLNIAVIKTEEPDEEKVHIGNVSFEPVSFNSSANELTVKASWQQLPDQSEKSTSVVNYVIKLYDANVSTTSSVADIIVPGDAITTNYTFKLNSSNYLNETNMVTNNHNYIIKVYGIDEAGNSGEENCASTQATDFCAASSEKSLKYKFTLKLTSTSNRAALVNDNTNIYLNESYTNEINVSSTSYSLSGITISMNNKNLTENTDYTYSLNSGSTRRGTFTINSGVINADVTVTASTFGACLVEGTKVRLYDGTTKNIEDIRYNDLLAVVSYDTGKIVYEYPIWIESKHTTDTYQITTFSDESTLKTVGNHGVFSADDNMYVSVTDKNKFHIGTKIIKINNNNEQEIVTVKKIEQKNEIVNYYHVSSTYYYNIIAENIVTTDDLLLINNMFAYNSNITWNNERNDFIKQNDLFSYDYLKSYFPYYLYKGLRMSETKILYNKGMLDIPMVERILNGKILEVPKTKNGNNKWMVTTSDNINTKKNKYYEEGSYYKLPKPKKVKGKTFVGWYNNADDKYYKSGDKVKVIYGMYFNAVWK